MKALFLIAISATAFLTLAASGYNFIMPDIELLVRVVDQDGHSVQGAEVVAWFPHVYGAGATPKGETKQVATDSDGKALLRTKTASSVSVGSRKSGYYESGGRQIDFMQMREESKPLKAEREIILKKIMNPIPLV